MRTWTTEMWLNGMPDEILGLLTEPDAIAQWAPVPFELLDVEGPRLEAGTHARVRGRLAGRQLDFDVEIHDAHDGRLALVASGPLSIGAEYLLRPANGGSQVRATVSVAGRGVLGRLLARSVEALLGAGALRASVARIGRELEPVPLAA